MQSGAAQQGFEPDVAEQRLALLRDPGGGGWSPPAFLDFASG